MLDPTPVYPWSDLVESEDGKRLTATKTGFYVQYPPVSWPVNTGATITHIKWVSEPIEDNLPTEEEPFQDHS